MKKIVATLLMLCGVVQALPVGNPGEASLLTNGVYREGKGVTFDSLCSPCFDVCDIWSVRVGFYGNYVYNSHLAVNAVDLFVPGNGRGRTIWNASLFTNAGYIALNLFDRIDGFVTLGTTTIRLDMDSTILSPLSALAGFHFIDTINFDTAFSWSVGGRITLLECNCFMLGVEGEYFRTKEERAFHRGPSNLWTAIDIGSTYSAWQLGLGASYEIAITCPDIALVPYIAATYSESRFSAVALQFPLDASTFSHFPELTADKRWGYAIGTTFTLCSVVGLTVEGRFCNETALYVNGQIRF